MADDEDVPDDLEDDEEGEADAPDLEDEDLGEEEIADDALPVADDEDDDDDAEEIPVASPKAEEEEDDDEADPDDVEADLDTILKDRIAAGTDDEDDDEEEEAAPEPEPTGDAAERVQPKRPEEFVCQSCFLVKHPSQLADPKNKLCLDCV